MPPCSASARWPCALQRLDQRLDLEPRAAEDDRATSGSPCRARGRAPPACARAARCRRPAGRAAACRPRSSRARSSRAPDCSGGAARSTGCAPASSPRTAPSAASSGVASRIASRSSAKPMSSISSASSSTSIAQVVELQRAAPDVIERAARRGDDDVGAALERADLLRASARRRRPAATRDADALRVLVDRFGDLHRQLARRHEHEAAGLRFAGVVFERAAAASAARTPRSCRCRSPPGRAGRVPASSSGIVSRWTGVGSS